MTSRRYGLGEATPVRWPRRHVHNGRCTSVRRGNTFTMGDAHPFAEATRSQWAMPLLYRTARLCRRPVIPDEFASPDGCIASTYYRWSLRQESWAPSTVIHLPLNRCRMRVEEGPRRRALNERA